MKSLALGSSKVLTKKAAVAAPRKSKRPIVRLGLALALSASVSKAAAAEAPKAAEATQSAASATANSPFEALRQRLFQPKLTTGACQVVTMDPRGHSGLDPGLDTLITQLMAALKKKDDLALQPLFHPRLNTSLAALKETFAKLDSVYGAPFDVSIYRLWALNTVDGSPSGLACPEQPGVKVFPHYGYPLQFALWLQLMGQKEIARIYVSLVPVGDHWYLGAFHSQQWTHDGKDPMRWIGDATGDVHQGRNEASYIKFDLTGKLLDGGGFLELALRDDVIKTRDAVMRKEVWDESLRKTLPNEDIVYSASIFVEGGAGIVVRSRVPGEISLEELKSRCKKIVDAVAKQKWGPSLAGVKCAFLLPGEKGENDGAQGGIFLPLKPKT